MWRGWESSNPMDRFNAIEDQMIRPLTTAQVGCLDLAKMLDAWEIEPDSELNEEICENLFHEIVVAVELVSSLARAAQAIQITQKVRPILL